MRKIRANYIVDPLEGKNREMQAQLRAVVREIRTEANGRTCGSCQHYREGWCAKVLNQEGDALQIDHPNAVACRTWTPEASP